MAITSTAGDGVRITTAAMLFIIAGLFKGMLSNIVGQYEPDEIARAGSENLERLKADE